MPVSPMTMKRTEPSLRGRGSALAAGAAAVAGAWAIVRAGASKPRPAAARPKRIVRRAMSRREARIQRTLPAAAPVRGGAAERRKSRIKLASTSSSTRSRLTKRYSTSFLNMGKVRMTLGGTVERAAAAG